MHNEYLRTSDLAKAVGLSVQQIRNYEAWGFLPTAERGPNGYRRYTPEHLAALHATKQMIAGFGWQSALAVMQAVHRGDLDAALSLVDGRHATLDRQRREAEQAAVALHDAAAQPTAWIKTSRGLRVGEAARRVGVRVSALRFWEQQDLLHPQRDRESRYRLYDEHQMRRLQMVVLLRHLNYDFDVIRSVLAEITVGRLERALDALKRRRVELNAASRKCVEATVALWNYLLSYNQHLLSPSEDV